MVADVKEMRCNDWSVRTRLDRANISARLIDAFQFGRRSLTFCGAITAARVSAEVVHK